MTTGRNDPCPCGSGRKYKQCCMSADRARTGTRLPAAVRAAAAAEPTWAADALPLMVRIGGDGDQRPVLVLVTAGELIVHQEACRRLGGEAADVAAALERAVAAAASAVGVWPATLMVRHDAVADALSPLVENRAVTTAVGTPPGLEAAGRGLLEHTTGFDWWPPAYRALSWVAWELPRGLVADLLAAAARFHRAAPWRDVDNLQAPRAIMPSGRAWTCCVLGNAGQQFGLSLYSAAEDLFEGVVNAEPDDPFAGMLGQLISITFDPMTDADPADRRDARRDARRFGWDVRGSDVVPDLMTVNTPAGGVTTAEARDLTALLDAVPRFVQAHRAALLREDRTGDPTDAIEWTDPDTAIVFRYAGEGAWGPAHAHDQPHRPAAMSADLHDEVSAVIRQVAEELGEDADEAEFTAAVNARLEQTMATHNTRPQAELGGLSPDQVRRLLETEPGEADCPIRLRTDLALDDLAGSAILANARALLHLAVQQDGLGATTHGNLKLDVVAHLAEEWRTYDDMDRFIMERGKRLKEQDLRPLHQLRIVAGLAGLLRKRSQRFLPTRKARSLTDDDRAGELFALLFRTWFWKFNLAYDSSASWPELQRQISFTLHRLRTAAAHWRTADELLPHVVLPFALDSAPARDSLGPFAGILLAGQVLSPLVGFGLLELRPAGRGRSLREDRVRVTPLGRSFLDIKL